eukprot:scaffold399648_cov18-Prasinocladus_malaysianus.AAC.1
MDAAARPSTAGESVHLSEVGEQPAQRGQEVAGHGVAIQLLYTVHQQVSALNQNLTSLRYEIYNEIT